MRCRGTKTASIPLTWFIPSQQMRSTIATSGSNTKTQNCYQNKSDGKTGFAKRTSNNHPDDTSRSQHCEDNVMVTYDTTRHDASQHLESSMLEYGDTSFPVNFDATINLSPSEVFQSQQSADAASLQQIIHENYASLFQQSQSSVSVGQPSQVENFTITLYQNGMFQCPNCIFCTEQLSTYRTHMLSHKVPRSPQCPFCAYCSSRNDNLLTHIRRHTGERPFSCDVCGRSFTGKSDLNLHKLTHTNEKPFACGLCDFKGRRKFDVKLHCNKVHAGECDNIYRVTE